MKRKSLVGAVCLVVGLLLTTQLTSLLYELKVNEAKTRFSFGAPVPEITLVIENGSTPVSPATIHPELLAPNNTTKATAERRVNLKSVKQQPFTPHFALIAEAKRQLFTPRQREYFPETLLWNPELTTDKRGRSQVDFKLANDTPTWKMSVIGSSAAGEMRPAETEIQSIQPFLADLDPPRELTGGTAFPCLWSSAILSSATELMTQVRQT